MWELRVPVSAGGVGCAERACPAFLAGWKPSSWRDGYLTLLRAASVPYSSSDQEELALLRRASSEEVFLLLVLAVGKDQGDPCWDQHQKSLCPVANQQLPLGVSSGGFSGQLFLYLKAIF